MEGGETCDRSSFGLSVAGIDGSTLGDPLYIWATSDGDGMGDARVVYRAVSQMYSSEISDTILIIGLWAALQVVQH